LAAATSLSTEPREPRELNCLGAEEGGGALGRAGSPPLTPTDGRPPNSSCSAARAAVSDDDEEEEEEGEEDGKSGGTGTEATMPLA